jgi:hypothetical protein
VATSATALKKSQLEELSPVASEDTFTDLPEDNDMVAETVVATSPPAVPLGGLASAIARSRTVQQTLEKTPRQLAQQKPGVRKL